MTMSTDVERTRDPDRQRYAASASDVTVAGFIDYQETSELAVLTRTVVGDEEPT